MTSETTIAWQPAIHQLVVTSKGLAVIEGVKAVKHNNLYHLRFLVRLIEVEPTETGPTVAVFGAAEIQPLILEKNPWMYRR